MILYEDYAIHYDIFLAEQELFHEMTVLGDMYLAESVGLMSLQESVKETIKKYTSKVVESIQKAWNRFKEIITEKKNAFYIKQVQKMIDKTDPKFIANNFPKYDITIADSMKVIPFNYEEMKPYLDSKKAYFKQYYPTIFTDEEKSFKENFEAKTLTSVQDTRITKDYGKQMLDFLVNMPSKMTNVETDLKTVNNSVTTIENVANSQVVSNTESVFVFTEAEEEEKKVEFKDDPDKEDSKGNSAMTKHISVYVGCSTEVLTAKMKIYRDVYALYIKCLKHYIKPENNDGEAKAEGEGGNETPQVET